MGMINPVRVGMEEGTMKRFFENLLSRISERIGKGIGEGFMKAIGRGYIVGIIYIIGFIILVGLGHEIESYQALGYQFVIPLIGVDKFGTAARTWAENNKKLPGGGK